MQETVVFKESLLAACLSAEGRERRRLFLQLRPFLEAADLPRIAVLVRDLSPKLTARVLALLARNGCEEILAAQLIDMKPARQQYLRAQYRRLAEATAARVPQTRSDPCP